MRSVQSTILYIVNEIIKELTVLVSHATHSKFLIILSKCIMRILKWIPTFYFRWDKKRKITCLAEYM